MIDAHKADMLRETLAVTVRLRDSAAGMTGLCFALGLVTFFNMLDGEYSLLLVPLLAILGILFLKFQRQYNSRMMKVARMKAQLKALEDKLAAQVAPKKEW